MDIVAELADRHRVVGGFARLVVAQPDVGEDARIELVLDRADDVREVGDHVVERPVRQIAHAQAHEQIRRVARVDPGNHLGRQIVRGVKRERDGRSGFLLVGRNDRFDRLVLLRVKSLLPGDRQIGRKRGRGRGEQRHETERTGNEPSGWICNHLSPPGNIGQRDCCARRSLVCQSRGRPAIRSRMPGNRPRREAPAGPWPKIAVTTNRRSSRDHCPAPFKAIIGPKGGQSKAANLHGPRACGVNRSTGRADPAIETSDHAPFERRLRAAGRLWRDRRPGCLLLWVGQRTLRSATGGRIGTKPRQLRLHHRRRRHGRLRAGQPAVGRPVRSRCCCSRPGGKDNYLWIHIPVGYLYTHGQSAHRLVLQDRGGGRPRRARAQLSARQGARRLLARSTA